MIRLAHLAPIVLAIGMAGLPLQAQNRVQAAFDTNFVELGDAVDLRILAFGTQPDTLLLLNWPPRWADSNVVTRSGWQRGVGTNQWRYTLRMVMLDSGRWQLPPVVVVGASGPLSGTDSLYMEVQPAPVLSTDPNDLAEIKPIWREPADWTDYWWLYLLLAIPLLGGLLWWAILRYLKTRKLTRSLQQSRLTARDWALRELGILAEKKLWQDGQVKAYHTELTDILRTFVQHQYKIPARYKTSTEIVRQLQQSPAFAEAQIAPLQALLDQADLVKFARNQPQYNYHEQAMQVALDWVRESP
jgi:hypothetical protein